MRFVRQRDRDLIYLLMLEGISLFFVFLIGMLVFGFCARTEDKVSDTHTGIDDEYSIYFCVGDKN